MPEQRGKSVKVITASALLMVMAATFWVAPRPLAGQDGPDTLTIIYGNDATMAVQDWHFVYEYLESDTALDGARVTACTTPSADESTCMKQTKTSRDLLLIGPVPGLSAVGLVPYVLPEGAVRAIRIHWKGGSEGGGRAGVTLKQDTPDDASKSSGITVLTTQGAQIYFPGRLQAPETFLSKKRYVYLLKLSLTGSAQVQGAPGRFELRLDERAAPASLKERVDEVHFQ